MNQLKLVTVVTLAAYLVVLVNGAPAEETIKTGMEAAGIGARDDTIYVPVRPVPGEIRTVPHEGEIPEDSHEAYTTSSIPSATGHKFKSLPIPPEPLPEPRVSGKQIFTPPTSLSRGTLWQELEKIRRDAREIDEKFQVLPPSIIEAQVKIRAEINTALRLDTKPEVITLDPLFKNIMDECKRIQPGLSFSSPIIREHVLSPLYDSVYQPEYDGKKLSHLLDTLSNSAPPLTNRPVDNPRYEEVFLTDHKSRFPSVLNAEVAKDLLACHMAFKEAMEHPGLEVTEVQAEKMGQALLQTIRYRLSRSLIRSLDYPYSKNPTRAKQLMQKAWDWVDHNGFAPLVKDGKDDFGLEQAFRKKGAEADFKILQVLENIQKSLKESATVALPDHELSRLIMKTEAGEVIDPSKLHAMLDRLFPLLVKQVSMGNNLNDDKTMRIVEAFVTAQLKAEPIMNIKENEIQWILFLIKESPGLKTFY